jgi:Ca-activated chloride channel homolog
MKPSVKFDRTLVTVLVDEVVHVMLELTAPPAVPVERAPLDVVVVLDRSGSMSGPPLASVTAATAQLLRLAGPDDRIGVVAFDDEVQLVLPLAHHEPEIAARAVLAIDSRGSTNLSGGWLKGLEMLTGAPRPEALRRIILLTDGHANAGITGADQLVPLIKSGYRQGVTTSCIGFDDGYDEQLLAALADGGMGNEYWCAGPDQAAQVFADEFGGLASVVAQNVSVEITPSDAVAATAVLNEFPITDLPNGVQVAPATPTAVSGAGWWPSSTCAPSRRLARSTSPRSPSAGRQRRAMWPCTR